MLMGVGLYLFDYNNAKSAPTAIAAGTAGGAVVTDTVQSGAIVTDSVQATSTLSTSAATTATQTTTQTTTIPDALLASYSEYTGVSPDDPSFGDAFGTIAAQGALSIFVSHTAFLLLLFLEPPIRFFTGWRKKVSEDKRPGILAAVLLIIFQVLYFVPAIGTYFGLLEKPLHIYAGILGLVVIWMFLIRTIWRNRLLERFLGMEHVE